MKRNITAIEKKLFTSEQLKEIEEAEKDILPGLWDCDSGGTVIHSSMMNETEQKNMTEFRKQLVKTGKITQERFEELEKM